MRKREKIDTECSTFKSTQERDSADRYNSLEKSLADSLKRLELEFAVKAQQQTTELAQLQQAFEQCKDLKATSAKFL